MLIAGRCGGEVQAAVGLGEQVIFCSVLLGTALSLGTAACVSRCYGAGEIELAKGYASDSLVLALIIGGFAAVAQWVFSDELLHLLNAPPTVLPLATTYLKLSASANIPFVAALCLGAASRALNEPRRALMLWGIIAVVSITGSVLPVMIWNLDGLQTISTLAISWDLGSTIGLLWAILSVEGQSLRARFSGDAWRRPPQLEVLTVSLPTIFGELAWLVSNAVMFYLLGTATEAVTTQAALAIALKIEETCASMPLAALSVSAGTLVGQSLGANNPTEARRSSWKICSYSALAMVIIGTLLSIFADSILSLLSSDQSVQHSAKQLLVWSPLLLTACAFWLIPAGAVEGAGCTTPPMLLNVLGYLFVRVPTAYFAMQIAPPIVAICAALAVSRVFLAATSLLLFNKGNWALCGLPSTALHQIKMNNVPATAS